MTSSVSARYYRRVSSKQKKALATLVVCALTGALAMLAPEVSCEIDPELVEDLLPDASAPADLGDGSSSSGGESSGSESSSG